MKRDTGVPDVVVSSNLFGSPSSIGGSGRRVKKGLDTNSVGCIGVSGLCNCSSSVISVSS